MAAPIRRDGKQARLRFGWALRAGFLRAGFLRAGFLRAGFLRAGFLSGLVLTGCSDGGPKVYKAGGRIEFADSKPLPGATVEFRSLDHTPALSARGLAGPDGTFRLGTRTQSDGAVEGRHSVMVMPALPALDRDEIRGPLPQPIDEKFQQFGTSGLEFTVTSDESKNEFVIKVHPPGN